MLAPVPCIHLLSAVDVCQRERRVAFATNLEGWFEQQDDDSLRPEEGWPVLIYASRPEIGDKAANQKIFTPSGVSFFATYAGWTQASAQGKHPNPEIRPTSTETDTETFGFWEVTNLCRLPRPIRFADLRVGARKVRPRVGFIPRRAYVVQGNGF